MLGLLFQRLTLMPKALLIIIDGLEYLNDQDTASMVKEFLEAIRHYMNQEVKTNKGLQRVKRVKVLVTKYGDTRGVISWLRPDECYVQDKVV